MGVPQNPLLVLMQTVPVGPSFLRKRERERERERREDKFRERSSSRNGAIRYLSAST